MRKLFSNWKPDMDCIVQDSRNISIALIIAGVVGLFLKEADFAGAVMVLLIGMALWAFAIQKR